MKRAFVVFILAWLLSACSNWQLRPPPPTTPGPPPAATPTPYFYVVQPGDTLWSISQKTGVDFEKLVIVNELENADVLHPGDRLLISDKMTISGATLPTPTPTPTPTPIPCRRGCVQPPKGCDIKGYKARLDGMKLYVTPGDEIYPLQKADVWFCREQDARNAGWRRWTPKGPEE